MKNKDSIKYFFLVDEKDGKGLNENCDRIENKTVEEDGSGENQEGSGIKEDNCLMTELKGFGNSSNFLDKLASEVASKLSSQSANLFNKRELNNAPQFDLVQPSCLPPQNFGIPKIKDDFNDKFDEQRLIRLVSKNHRKSAKFVLDQLNERGAELSYDSQGTVYIDQISLPQANMFEIFPNLFKTYKKTSKIEGYQEVFKKLEVMGLRKFLGQQKRQNLKEKQVNETNSKNANHAWYYIG